MSKSITRRATPQGALRLTGITAIGAAAALTLSSCGSGVPALEDVWPEVSSSIENATSVAIDGSVSQGGQDVTVAISGQIDDSSYSGNVKMDEADVEVVGNAEYTYMKPNAAFYQQLGGASLQDMVGDKWLEMPAEQGGFTMSSFWESFSKEIPSAEEFGNSEYTSEAVELNGEEVYKYTGTDADTGEPVSVYVSQDNKLARVEVADATSEGAESTDGASASPSPSASPSTSGEPSTGAVNFSQWDAVEPVEMPADEEIFAVPGM
jgi:hypothetical protein